MSAGRLFLSFGHISLENLPEGTFARRKIAPDDARLRIEQARKNGALQCVSDDDLAAPYRDKERKHHEALCHTLGEHYGITLSLKEFFVKDDAEAGGLYTIFPLQSVRVEKDDRLLIVTCMFALPSKGECKPGNFNFAIDPPSVEFHLIEAV